MRSEGGAVIPDVNDAKKRVQLHIERDATDTSLDLKLIGASCLCFSKFYVVVVAILEYSKSCFAH